MGTLFSEVYNTFLGKITDDLYIELTPEDTRRDVKNLLLNALPGFEFPRKNLIDYTIDTIQMNYEDVTEKDFIVDYEYNDDGELIFVSVDRSAFNVELTTEEINILALLMLCEWVQRQVTSIENTRMKYSGQEFKMTSQANHLSKLLALLAEVQRQSFHMQRLYKRRTLSNDNIYKSNWSVLRNVSALE